jgi:hypothetical protein
MEFFVSWPRNFYRQLRVQKVPCCETLQCFENITTVLHKTEIIMQSVLLYLINIFPGGLILHNSNLKHFKHTN